MTDRNRFAAKSKSMAWTAPEAPHTAVAAVPNAVALPSTRQSVVAIGVTACAVPVTQHMWLVLVVSVAAVAAPTTTVCGSMAT